jgi:methyltransferase
MGKGHTGPPFAKISVVASHVLFTLLCIAVGVERLLELRRSREHAAVQSLRGGELVPEPAFFWMAILHGAVLICAVIESWLRPASWHPWVRVVAGAALIGATALRVWTLTSLGAAWSVRVTRFPDGSRPVITRGPYRYIRHPNYLAVIVEVAALPLVGGAWLTALAGSIANAVILARRIPFEEREMMRDPRWSAVMADKPRFIPRLHLGGPWIHRGAS